MLINFTEIDTHLKSRNMKFDGAFHIGAHECEELEFYHSLGLKNENIVWIDAIPTKVNEATNKGIPNVHHAIITDKDDDVKFLAALE